MAAAILGVAVLPGGGLIRWLALSVGVLVLQEGAVGMGGRRGVGPD